MFLWLYYVLFYFLPFIFYFILFSSIFVIYFLLPNANFHLANLSQSAFAFSMTIQMLKTQRRVGIAIHTKENIGLVRSTMFAVILCCLLEVPVFLVTEAVAPKRSIKSPKLPFNKEETLTHVFSREIHETLKNIPLYRAPPGAASVVTYLLKITELPPGLERKIIRCLIIAFMFCVYCSHNIYTKNFYQVLFVAYFSGFLPVSASIFNVNFSIDCVKCINIIFLQ